MHRGWLAAWVCFFGVLSTARADVAQVELVGRVFASDTGRPLSGILIYLSQGCAFAANCSMQTDATGTFELWALPGAATIYANGNNSTLNYLPFSTDFTVDAGHANNLVIHMQPAASISGTVTRAADAAPIPNATVKLYAIEDHVIYTFSEAGTDAAGRYSIGQIPPGEYQVGVESDAYLPQFYAGRDATPPSQGPQSADSISVTGAQSITSIDFSVSPSGTLHGIISDLWTGQPIADPGGITFFLHDGSAPYGYWLVKNVPTDANGHYRIGGLPPWPLIVEVDDFSYPRYSTEVLGCASHPCNDVSSATRVTVGATDNLALDFGLFPSQVITGTVTSQADGMPIAGATVKSFAYEAQDNTAYVDDSVVTDAQGHYVLHANYFLDVPKYIEVTDAHTDTQGFFGQFYSGHDCAFPTCVGFTPYNGVHPQDYQVTTSIDFALDPAGSIIGQTTVDGLAADLDVYVELYSSTGTLIDGFFSEHDGSFSTQGLAPGTYYLAAYPPSGNPADCVIYANTPCAQIADITRVGTPVVVSGSALHLSIELSADAIFRGDFEP